MSIILYSGVPGSGKSLAAAQLLYNNIAAGHYVIGNMPLELDKIKTKKEKHYLYIDNQSLTPRKLVQVAKEINDKKVYRENSILLVIDECQLLFNSRTFAKNDRLDWLEFFSQHRKMGFKIILIAQFDRMIDRQIRCLIEIERKHRIVGSFGIFRFIPFSNRCFCEIEYYYPLNERQESSFFFLNKKYYSIYDTNITFSQVN